MQIKATLSLILVALITLNIMGQEPTYRISGSLENYTEDSIFLGYYFMDKQYLLDTAVVEDNHFTFSDTSALKPGVYLVVMPPDNRFFQLMITDSTEVSYSFTADVNDLENSIEFTNSPDNKLFYSNLRYIAKMRDEVNNLNSKAESATPEEKERIDGRLQAINEEVSLFQRELVANHAGSLTSALVQSGFQIELPVFEGTPEEVNLQKYHYYKNHYFDYVDLSDERLLRSPAHVMHDRVNYYIDKLTPQHPDSIIVSIDFLLQAMRPASETYRQYLVKFLNDYAASKIVGMDAVYVHLALNYYAQGEAPWVDDEQLAKIIGNARDAEPTLIGKTAPNLKVQSRDSTDIYLHDIESEYVILMFWAHDCSHCKESMPKLKEFYDRRAGQGIEVLSVCTKFGDDEPPCWDFVDEKGLDGWINASDKNGGRSFMHKFFNIKKTPKLFILDKDKKIISKDLGVEQLDEFCDQVILSEK